MHSECLGLVLADQPISALADLSAEFEEAGREVFRGLEPVVDNEDLDAGTETPPEAEMEMAVDPSNEDVVTAVEVARDAGPRMGP